jgi:hypothetical protein
MVAIATILITLYATVGPLLQRATSVVISTTTSPVKLSGHVASELPLGYTGALSPDEHAGGALQHVILDFANALGNFDKNQPIQLEQSGLAGCAGNCSAVVQAAGIVANCSSSVTDWGINTLSDPDGVLIFQVTSTWDQDLYQALQYTMETITLSVCRTLGVYSVMAFYLIN